MIEMVTGGAEMDNFSRIRGGRVYSKRVPRGLLICFVDPNGPVSVYEHVSAWQERTAYSLEVINLWPGTGQRLAIPATVKLRDYGFIIFHPTVTYNPDNVAEIDRLLAVKIVDFDGVKVFVKQDEQFCAYRWADIIASKKIDILVTCLKSTEQEKVYPRSIIGNDVSIVPVLTGYITDRMLAAPSKSFEQRAIDVGYRGSVQPLSFGRLGFEKRSVGAGVLRHASQMPSLVMDISSRWEDRLGGAQWTDFLGSAKIVLGAESGSNAFDLDGKLSPLCSAYEAVFSEKERAEDSFYLDAHRAFLHRYEGNVDYAQIAPRHFEAAAARSVQLMYEGEYSDLFKPFEHFLPLKRDFSNISELLEIGLDPRRAREMTERAYDEIVRSSAVHFSAFVSLLDKKIEAKLLEKNVADRSSSKRSPSKGTVRRVPTQTTTRPKALVVMAHEPTGDPRVGWVSNTLAKDFEVCEVGTYWYNTVAPGAELEKVGPHLSRVRVERNRHNSVWQECFGSFDDSVSRVFNRLSSILSLDDRSVDEIMGPSVQADSLTRFRGYCQYFLNSNSALLEACRSLGQADVVVVVDLEALPAGVAYAKQVGALLVYDAHEYWPYAVPEFEAWECEFWSSIEADLVRDVDVCCTVTPQLGDVMARRYGKDFIVVPNCAPPSDAEGVVPRCNAKPAEPGEPTSFLYQGNFAPGRGVELMLDAWRHKRGNSTLILRGLDSTYKDKFVSLSKELNLYGDSVSFPVPVKEEELIRAASTHDVGMISYQPLVINNRFCCPNKMSQYMAAGVPIVASSNLDFVKSIIRTSGSGILVDYNNREEFLGVVSRLESDPELRRKLGSAGREFFDKHYNWDAVSAPLFNAIHAALKDRVSENRADFSFDWIKRGQMCVMASTATSEAKIASNVESFGFSSPAEYNGSYYSQEFELLKQRNIVLENFLSDIKTPRGLMKQGYYWVRHRIRKL